MARNANEARRSQPTTTLFSFPKLFHFELIQICRGLNSSRLSQNERWHQHAQITLRLCAQFTIFQMMTMKTNERSAFAFAMKAKKSFSENDLLMHQMLMRTYEKCHDKKYSGTTKYLLKFVFILIPIANECSLLNPWRVQWDFQESKKCIDFYLFVSGECLFWQFVFNDGPFNGMAITLSSKAMIKAAPLESLKLS